MTRRHEMPQQGILEVELFDVWGVDFIGPLPPSNGYKHILVAVDYVSKWVEAIPTVHADAKAVCKLFKDTIFPRFGVPRIVISDGGAHFNNHQLEALLAKYGVKNHRVITHTIHKPMVRMNCLTGRLNQFWRKLFQNLEQTGQANCQTHSGLTGQLTKLPLVCHHSG